MEAEETVNTPLAVEGCRSRNAGAAKRKRSAVTNGSRAFIEGDGNSPWYRRFKDLLALHVDDLGGPESLSEAQMSLCRRAATLEVELERIEGQLSLGHDADIDAYSRHAGGLRRILETLGINRLKRSSDTPMTLQQYLATRQSAVEVAEDD